MNPYPNVIGLNGVARAGKDTIANVLHQIYGYRVLSFSDALNKALIALNPWISTGGLAGAPGVGTYERYASAIKRLGYEQAKDTYPEVRRLLQHMGTEVGRNMLGADIWVDALFATIDPNEKVVITNVRFPNEYEAVKDYEGVVWRVDRPGFEPALDHISDRALDAYSFDQWLYNDGTIEDLAQKVISIMDESQPIKAALQSAFNGGIREG